jgi:hypothetical protein
MRIGIRSHSLDVSAAGRRDFERRMDRALRAFSRYIQAVSVSIRDINGPRGGRDKRGQVVVRLRRGNSIVVTAKNERFSALASQLAPAARRAVKAGVRRRQMHSIRAFRRLYRPSPVTGAASAAARHATGN